MRTTISSDRVVLGEGAARRVGPATLHVEGGRIVRVEEGVAQGEQDLAGCLLTPALVDAHTHLAMSAFRGIGGAAAMAGNVVEDLYFRLEAALQPGDVRAFARMGAWECLLSGTGTVWEHYYGGRELVEALQDVGLGGVVAPTLQDRGGPGVGQAEAALELTRELAQDAALHHAGIVPALGPHASDTVSAALWGRIVELADELHLPLHLHLAQSIDEVRRAWREHGCSPLAWLDRVGALQAGPARLLVHALFLDRRDLLRVAETGSTLGYCPASQAQFAFPADLQAWQEAGAAWALGTDCGSCNDTMNLQAELRLAAVGERWAVTGGPAARAFRDQGLLVAAEGLQAERDRHYQRRLAGLAPTRLLAAAWADLHPALPVGALREGARADLVAWDLAHPALWPAAEPLQALVLQDAAPAIHGLMRGGRWLGTPGDFHRSLRQSEAYRAHHAEAAQRLALLRGRAGLD